MKIAMIDYDAGNLGSASRAARRAGLDIVITRDLDEIRNAQAIILPGVGAIGDAMKHLDAYGLSSLLKDEVKKGKKLAGICIGMQVLYDYSEEDGGVNGLGILPGRVARLPKGALKVPHMGWNEIVYRKPHWTSRGLPEHPYVYFVHSYYKVPADTDDVIAAADYGVQIPAITGKDNVIAFQFHPEKSGDTGIVIWKNLAEWLRK